MTEQRTQELGSITSKHDVKPRAGRYLGGGCGGRQSSNGVTELVNGRVCLECFASGWNLERSDDCGFAHTRISSKPFGRLWNVFVSE